MAQIQIALAKTLKFEGGYSNDKLDKGGETYKGISRLNFPNWSGWSIVDTVKETNPKSIDSVLKANPHMKELVESFYKANFWDKIQGDRISSQEVANNIFDFAVNSGVSRASKYAQNVVGAVQDGQIGNKSIEAINAMNAVTFVKVYKRNRQNFLNKIVENNPSQIRFLAGWTNRVNNA